MSWEGVVIPLFSFWLEDKVKGDLVRYEGKLGVIEATNLLGIDPSWKVQVVAIDSGISHWLTTGKGLVLVARRMKR